MQVNVKPVAKQVVMLSKELLSCSFDLKVSEIAIFLSILGKINQSKELASTTWFTITSEDLAEVRQVTKRTAEEELKSLEDSINTLWESTFTSFDKETGEKTINRWIISMRKQANSYKIRLHPDIFPYIVQLRHYFSIPLTKVGRLSHKMSYRLLFLVLSSMEYTKQKEGTIKIHFPAYLSFLGLDTSSYSSFNNFRQKLCVPAMEELLKVDILKHIRVTKVSKTDYFLVHWAI